MGVTETIDGVRTDLTTALGTALVAVSGLLLLVDLVLKLANVEVFVLGGALPLGQFGTYVWSGLVIGLVIGLASIGLSLTYSILNFANFAHGDYVTWGAFTGWGVAYLIAGLGEASFASLILVRADGGAAPTTVGASVTNTPFAILLGLVGAIILTVVFSLFIDKVVYRPMRDAEGISLLIASVGVAFALRYFIAFVFNTSRRGVTDPRPASLPRTTVGGIIIDAHEVTIIVAAIALMLGVHLMLQYTKLGKAMRAMADNRDLARVTGIPTERVIRSTWIIGGGLAGAAGYLVVLTQGTIGFRLGWLLLLLIFAAVIMGGIGSVYGAILGGVIIGLASKVSIVWVPAEFTKPVAFGLMILILLFRPEGIFGGVSTA